MSLVGIWWSRSFEGGALVSEISDLTKETQWALLFSSHYVGAQWEAVCLSAPRETSPDYSDTWLLDFAPPEHWEVVFVAYSCQ